MTGEAYAAALLAVITAPTGPAKAALLDAISPPADGSTWAAAAVPAAPGRPAAWRVVDDPPRRRRGLNDAHARNRFLLAIHHIELSAIDLACLLCLRGSGQPSALHADMLAIAREEAVHAGLLDDLLSARGCPPGSAPIHHKLWHSALAASDVGEQLVVVPRFLEARGLDVSAELLPRLRVCDAEAATVIERIYTDEQRHVAVGTRWHHHWCAAQGISPEAHFAAVVAKHFAGQLPSPFALDEPARRRAGFTTPELDLLRAPRR